MKQCYTKLTAALILAASSMGLMAHNPYEGQYEVQKVPNPRFSSFDCRPGELIIKFKAEGTTAAPKLKCANGKVRASSSAQTLNNLLDKYSANVSEELMPLTGAQVTPMQRRTRAFNGEDVNDTDLSSLFLIRLDASKTTNLKEVADEFSALPEVEYAEPNYTVYACSSDEADYTSDPLYSQQWGPAAIGLDKLWQVPTITTNRPIIAILDTGVDIEHPDLAANIWTNEIEANGSDDRDDDANGFTDDIHGWDFVNQSARMRDNNGHGTHCAGIAAAVGGNGIGITGANPEALIMPVAVLQSNGTGDIATIIKGIDYAVANGADIISMSFGGYTESMAERDALGKAYQKAILVAAAGNDSRCIYSHKCPINSIYGSPMYPAAYNFVLGVEASSNADGSIASFSNFDHDGPITTTFANLENYELRAPGTSVISTFPGGQYKSLNGTSMACPLVAGAISRLISCREISSKEELFGDLIATAKGNIDIFGAYNLKDSDRKPTLSLVTYRLDDVKMGDGDGRPDAGETIRIYPTFRNSWGNARNIKYSIKLHELEDSNIIEFIDSEDAHVISNLSSYASVEAEAPFLVKISPDCVDGRIIRFIVEATCDNISETLSQEIEFSVENGVELGGIIREDMTLTPDKNYFVTSMLVIPEKITLTLMPGTTLKFKDGTAISVSNGNGISIKDYDVNGNEVGTHYEYPDGGKIVAIGTPENRIIFTKAEGDKGETYRNYWEFGFNSNYEYCDIRDIHIRYNDYGTRDFGKPIFNKSIIHYLNFAEFSSQFPLFSNCSYYDNYMGANGYGYNFFNSNIIRNELQYVTTQIYKLKENYLSNNSFNNYFYFNNRKFQNSIGVSEFIIGQLFTTSTPSYFGSNNEGILHQTVWDIKNSNNINVGVNAQSEIDLSNRLNRPNPIAPGIVWKVVVNDYDAQDEYELLPPLGVGKHKFEVYFSKQMNHEKTPMIAMGVREPYTQIAIGEDGSWRSETMENGDVLDIDTAYLTIKGKDNFDGVNTIYVADAEDEEFFPIPIEDVRFHVNVQSAGAMSSGFTAEAGVGRVKLTWENPEENFDDMLGYNMYRYTLDENDVASEPVKINETLLTEEELIDYDIVPGTTYCYYYKVLRTSLDENAPSKIVAATPRAAGKGDANASGDVDVSDVVTEVNYMVGKDPKPFMFEAADINSDNDIDILDVVGTVNIIMHPEAASAMALAENSAVYSIENGILYVESSIDLSGVQVDINSDVTSTKIKTLEALRGMETTGDWLNENAYRFVAFSLSGKTLESGKQPILEIGNAEIDNIILVDAAGKKVLAMRGGDTTGISSIMSQQINLPYPNPFFDVLNVPVIIASNGTHDVEISISNLAGVTPVAKSCELGYGEHVVTLNTSNLPEGFYIVTLVVDGKKIHSVKAIKK